jgi:hypothetical protein
VGDFPLGRVVAISDKWNGRLTLESFSVRFLTFSVVTPCSAAPDCLPLDAEGRHAGGGLPLASTLGWNADTLPYIDEPRMPLIVAVELLRIPIEDAESVI